MDAEVEWSHDHLGTHERSSKGSIRYGYGTRITVYTDTVPIPRGSCCSRAASGVTESPVSYGTQCAARGTLRRRAAGRAGRIRAEREAVDKNDLYVAERQEEAVEGPGLLYLEVDNHQIGSAMLKISEIRELQGLFTTTTLLCAQKGGGGTGGSPIFKWTMMGMVGMEAPKLIAEQIVTHIRHGTLRQIFDNQGGVVKQKLPEHRSQPGSSQIT
ncbi:hypothetical protein C8J57DRAFT_1245974 [Mycena rebaudengoi]|nr:hypothetical protein C8J57DRAFT_1245974 [Mycena rebaudengoi]